MDNKGGSTMRKYISVPEKIIYMDKESKGVKIEFKKYDKDLIFRMANIKKNIDKISIDNNEFKKEDFINRVASDLNMNIDMSMMRKNFYKLNNSSNKIRIIFHVPFKNLTFTDLNREVEWEDQGIKRTELIRLICERSFESENIIIITTREFMERLRNELEHKYLKLITFL